MSLRSYMGSATREAVAWGESDIGAWRGRVIVTPIKMGDRTEFEVSASWHGPPQQGFPPDDRFGDRTDTIQVSDFELAREVAMRAVEQLRRSERWPDGQYAKFDLRELLRQSHGGKPHGIIYMPSGETVVDPVAGPPPDPKS